MILPKLFPRPSIKSLSGDRRNWAKSQKLYLTADNRIRAKLVDREIKYLDLEICRTIPLVRSSKVGPSALKRLLKLRSVLELALLDQIAVPFDVRKMNYGAPSKRRGPSVTIDGWDDTRVPEDFRVDTKVELWDLFACFQFPDKMKSKWGHKFTGEEVFLFGMYRLCNIFKLQNQLVSDVFGFNHMQLASECFHCFLHFMVTNWGYLLTNNFDFWVPHLWSCAASIRFKAIEKGVTFPRELTYLASPITP